MADREVLIHKRKESLALLGAMYEVIGIDRDFRSLIAIGYMNDFIRLGISNKLTGVDGLYYIIQQRIHWDALHTKLDDISSKLDTIINNQDRIYYELCEMNDKSERLLKCASQAIQIGIDNGKQLEEIQNNTGVIAYNAERMRAEYEFRNMVGWN